jgi:hypothetical protein
VFADYIKYWKHNGWWLFNSATDIEDLCRRESINVSGNTLFYYEVFEKQFTAETKAWLPFSPEVSFPTCVRPPANATLIGYDVTTFSVGTSPECSPLSCNSLAEDIPVNRHCLFDTFDQAVSALEAGRFDNSEPGPFRIFAVYTVAAA